MNIVINADYQQGMGTSLRSGLAAAALIVLADQPWVTAETLDHLIACHQERKPQIIVPVYKGFRGNPVLLDRSVFAEVQSLNGDVGCRAIFGDHTGGICKLPVNDPGILLDIDSRNDLESLNAAGQPSEPGIAALESREDIVPGLAELVLVGRDAVVQALAKFGRILNFVVTVADPFLRLAELPEADRILHALDFSLLPASSERYCVVASRGQFDEEAVQQAVISDFPYIALLANKKRAQEVVRSLGAQSIPAEKLAVVRAPAGLEIGARRNCLEHYGGDCYSSPPTREIVTMRETCRRVGIVFIYCFVFSAVACLAQKPSAKPDDWPLQNASIGPVEIAAGTSRQVQVMYPTPDGPSFPLKASVTWSIEPAVKGISIDKTGMLKIDADVPHGTTATILGDVEHGRRKLSGKVYVFHPDENPLIGVWHVDTRMACGESQEIKAGATNQLTLRGYNWSFHASQEFWVGRENSIAARTQLAGSYKLDVKSGKLELTPTWPKKPVSNWSYLFKDGGKTLILRPMQPQADLEAGCSYILMR